MRYITILLFTTLTLPALADYDIDKSLTAKVDGEVKIDVISGDVKIEGWAKPAVRVSGEIDGNEKHFSFESDGNVTTIQIDHENHRWGWNSHGNEAELVVYVPTGSSVYAEGKSTDFEIVGVHGTVRVYSLSGDIDAEGLNNATDLESVSGDISIRDSEGKMNLESVSGDVVAKVKAIEFDAHSVSGDVEASIGYSEQVRLASVSGDIDLTLTLANKGRLEAETVSGDVEIVFENKVINARFDLETGPGGDIDNKITNDRADESFLGSGSISFKSGDGSAVVKVDTMSGTIKVSD